jgi:hypothetical protein
MCLSQTLTHLIGLQGSLTHLRFSTEQISQQNVSELVSRFPKLLELSISRTSKSELLQCKTMAQVYVRIRIINLALELFWTFTSSVSEIG